jgi:16S rRNA (guanine527-N7)-methyltransferase
MFDDLYVSRILAEYGFDPRSVEDPEFISKLFLYIDILKKWSQKVSLTSITDKEEIIRKHFGESLHCLKFVDIVDGRLADVGAGAGFPSLPIKLARPSLAVDLYEPNLKKATFLNEVIRLLGLSLARVIRERIPETQPHPLSLQHLTARAVAGQEGILGWARGALERHGNAILWVGKRESDALLSLRGWEWKRPILIPGNVGSYIVHGRKLDQAS